MAKRSLWKTIFLFSFAFAFFYALNIVRGQAASPQFLMSWKTSGSYIPSFYQGKALPTYGSKITASLEIISNGQPLNLQSQTIYWYLNDNLLGGGAGAQHITFSPVGEPPSFLTLKAELPNYNGSFLVHSIQIPMVNPQVVIYAPYANGQFSENPLTLFAYPYFWNTASADNLSFSWAVNGQTGSNTENPDEVQINLPAGTVSGTNITVTLTTKNNFDSTSAFATTNLTYVKQL